MTMMRDPVLAPTGAGQNSAAVALLAPPGAARLLPREIVLGLFLTGTSGLAILGHAFAAVPMALTVPFVAVPAAVILVGAVILGQRRFTRLHLFSRCLARGAAWGLAATLCYDAVRPLVTVALRASFDPFMAHAVFGSYITGLPPADPLAVGAGWVYHFWNGISFGMTFALARPRGGLVIGLAWGLTLEALMLITYPEILQVRLSTPGFVATGLIGHAIWGMVLGAGLRASGVAGAHGLDTQGTPRMRDVRAGGSDG
jgi:hypothetical protein